MAKKKITVGRSMLDTITVALYENPIILFREYVQNSLDAHNRAVDEGAQEIENIEVTITVDETNRTIVIKDNGYGIPSAASFGERMLSIGSSGQKADKTRYIGFRGIGRISGLPFCEKLTFRNKAANSTTVNECSWMGKEYRDKLSDQGAGGDLSTIIDEIVTIDTKTAEAKDKSKHYFEVVLEGYSDDIQATLDDINFKQKLIRMLPLQYDRGFKGATTIMSRYKSFMKEDIKRFMIPVKLDGESLCKSYDDSFVLDSDIIFWEVRGKKKKDQSPGDKIGLLWFTFAAHLKDHKNDQYYGILTRSKNVLMGGNDTFAQVADSNSSYVTTFREMTQTLRGVYGELLINSQHLSDNSRRDWFLPDDNSRDLNNVITEFMRRLNKYRYSSSRYFRKGNPTNTKEDLKKALDELVDLKANAINFDTFSKRDQEPVKTEPSAVSLSDEDLPHESKTMKKQYDVLMKVIEAYFLKIKKRVLFLELRAFIAKHFEQK
ncbi:MAG: ATP-binding protein [Syntrophales bacterium]